jgi:aromatic ring-opening dioxygenase LigB subunit
MPEIVFACISPHPPIILPSVGSDTDRQKVKKTIENLNLLEKKLKAASPDLIIISAPHSEWGFNVPLSFLAKDFRGEIKRYLTSAESPLSYFEEGKRYRLEGKKKIAMIASGDLSHCLKEDGPYGFNPQGPAYDKDLISCLKKKDIKKILKLEEKYPEAGECGLRSFCFMLGVLESLKTDYQPEILSYEGPFGVGYLVADFKLS